MMMTTVIVGIHFQMCVPLPPNIRPSQLQYDIRWVWSHWLVEHTVKHMRRLPGRHMQRVPQMTSVSASVCLPVSNTRSHSKPLKGTWRSLVDVFLLDVVVVVLLYDINITVNFLVETFYIHSFIWELQEQLKPRICSQILHPRLKKKIKIHEKEFMIPAHQLQKTCM